MTAHQIIERETEGGIAAEIFVAQQHDVTAAPGNDAEHASGRLVLPELGCHGDSLCKPPSRAAVYQRPLRNNNPAFLQDLVTLFKRLWNGPFADELTDPFARVNRDGWRLGLGILAGMIATIVAATIAGGAP